MKPVTIELDPWLVDRVDELARVTRQTRTSFVITALIAEVTRLSGATVIAPAEPRESRAKAKDPLSGDELKAFDEFWGAVPRRVDKGRARMAFKQAIKKDKPEVIIEGAKRWASAMRERETQFIKHPSSWLNAEGWLDEHENRTPQYMTTTSSSLQRTDAYREELRAYKEKVKREREEERRGNG